MSDHEDLCNYDESWICDCVVIREARKEVLAWPGVVDVYERGRARGFKDALAAIQKDCHHTKYVGCRPCIHDELRDRLIADMLTEEGQLIQGKQI